MAAKAYFRRMVGVRSVLVTVCLSLVLSVTSAVPAQAVTPNAPKPTASVAAPMAGEQFRLTGELPDPDARKVYLQVKDSSADWRNLSTQNTTTGAYNFLVRITKNTYFRVASPAAGSGPIVYTHSLYVPVVRQGVALWITRG